MEAAEGITEEAVPEIAVVAAAASSVVVEVAVIEAATEALGEEAGAPGTLQTHQMAYVTAITPMETKVTFAPPP